MVEIIKDVRRLNGGVPDVCGRTRGTTGRYVRQIVADQPTVQSGDFTTNDSLAVGDSIEVRKLAAGQGAYREYDLIAFGSDPVLVAIRTLWLTQLMEQPVLCRTVVDIHRITHNMNSQECIVPNKLPPIHPGEILNEEFLVPMKITQYRLAKAIGVDARRIHAIVHGQRSISAETALLLSRFFGNSAQFWMGLQSQYDLEIAEDGLSQKLNLVTRRASA